MRKEVILGMTIGGTLLAVVIIYITFSSNSKRDNHTVDTGGLIAEAGGAGDAPGQSGDGGAGATGEYKPLDSAFGTPKGGEHKADPRSAAPREASKHQLLVATNVDKMDPIWGNHLWPKVAVSVTPDPNAGAVVLVAVSVRSFFSFRSSSERSAHPAPPHPPTAMS